MSRKCFLCALLLFLSVSTSAQIVVRLWEEAEVAGPQILLAELGEIEGEEELVRSLGQTPVGVAPRPGERRTIHVNADLAPRLRRAGYRPEDFVWEGPQVVQVTGKVSAQEINRVKEDLEAQLLAYLNTHPKGQNYRWQVEIFSGTIPSWVKGEGRLSFRKEELPVGKVTLTAEAGQPARTFFCQATIQAFGSPLVTGRELAAGELLASQKVRRAKELELTSYLALGKQPLFQLEANLHLTRSLPADVILTWEDADYPLLVKKGDSVTIFVDMGAIQVQAPGRALADGKLGEQIKVMNTSSERIVEGIVTEEGFVKARR